ncbi:putative reverse transcriptase domain-containing protein [Tanacetum coccineum]
MNELHVRLNILRLTPAYVPDPLELDEHVPVDVPEPEHPEYHVPSDDDMQVEDQPYAEDASLTAESPGYIADSDSIEEDADADSIDYPDEPKDGNEDPKKDDDKDLEEDPREEHDPEDDDKDPEKDPIEEHEPKDEDTNKDEPSKGSDETESFEENETAATPPPPGRRGARISVGPQTIMAASTQTLIDAFADGSPPFPLPPTSPAYDQAPLGHRAAMIRIRDDIPEEDMAPRRRFVFTAPPHGCDVAESYVVVVVRPPRGRYDFVDTVEAGQGLSRSPGHDAQTIARSADIAEDVGYTDCRDIRLKIDVVRGQRTTYETELHERQTVDDRAVEHRMRTRVLEVRAQIDMNHVVTRQGTNDAMTPESIQAMIDRAIQRNSTHTQDDEIQSLGGGLRRPVQPTRVCSYTNFMKCQPLNFKGTEGVVGLSQWLKKMESVFHISGCTVDYQVKFTTYTLLGAALTWWNGHVRTLGHDAAYAMTWGTLKKKLTDKYCPKAYTQRFQELALMCTKFLADETEKVDKYISGLPDNIHGNVMSARLKTLDDAIELANDLMDQKLQTYTERQNDNKRKADNSSGNNQQPHKKQNVVRAYTAGPGEKKAYTGNLPLCTKCNYHHTGQCVPKCGNCKRYGHTTNDCRVNTNNNKKKNQKARACYECGNTRHIKKNCPKLKNHGNSNGNGTAQGRAYALGG